MCADEERLPLEHASVDLVVSCLGLHWLNDLPGTMVQCRRALRPDGLFLSAFLGGCASGRGHSCAPVWGTDARPASLAQRHAERAPHCVRRRRAGARGRHQPARVTAGARARRRQLAGPRGAHASRGGHGHDHGAVRVWCVARHPPARLACPEAPCLRTQCWTLWRTCARLAKRTPCARGAARCDATPRSPALQFTTPCSLRARTRTERFRPRSKSSTWPAGRRIAANSRRNAAAAPRCRSRTSRSTSAATTLDGCVRV